MIQARSTLESEKGSRRSPVLRSDRSVAQQQELQQLLPQPLSRPPKPQPPQQNRMTRMMMIQSPLLYPHICF